MIQGKIVMKTKKLVAIILSFFMMIGIVQFSNPLSAQAAANYSSDYRTWSQNKSAYSWMQGYGCGIVANSKMIYELGINSSSSFNPDTFYNYCLNKGYVTDGGFTGTGGSGGEKAVVNYAKSLGNSYLSCLETKSFSSSQMTDMCKYIIGNARSNYYTVIYGYGSGTHFVYVNNAKTKEATSNSRGQIYIFDSYGSVTTNIPGTSVTLGSYPNYKIYTFKYTGIWLKEKPTVSTTTNSASISGTIKNSTPISKWGYYISTDQTALSNFSGTIYTSETHTGNPAKNIYYKLVNDWSSSPKKTDTVSTTISSYNGSALSSNKTYYFRLIYKVNNNWHESNVYSFTTKASTSCADIGHNTVKDYGYAATCTKSGLTDGSHCSRCGAIITSQKIISATGHKSVSANNAAPATCTTNGKKADMVCSVCGVTTSQGATVNATGHSPILANNIIPATCTENGKDSDTICSICNAVISQGSTIYATGHIANTNGYCVNCGAFMYNPYPSAAVNTQTNSYIQQDNTSAPATTVISKPKTVKITKISTTKNKITIKWKKSSDVSKYQIQYATNKKFNNKKSITVNGSSTSKVIKNLTSKKKYYVRVRAYKESDGIRAYGAWSKTASIKVK